MPVVVAGTLLGRIWSEVRRGGHLNGIPGSGGSYRWRELEGKDRTALRTDRELQDQTTTLPWVGSWDAVAMFF